MDPEQRESADWDIGFVWHFMYVSGPLSSIFNFVNCWVMLSLLHAGQARSRLTPPAAVHGPTMLRGAAPRGGASRTQRPGTIISR